MLAHFKLQSFIATRIFIYEIMQYVLVYYFLFVIMYFQAYLCQYLVDLCISSLIDQETKFHDLLYFQLPLKMIEHCSTIFKLILSLTVIPIIINLATKRLNFNFVCIHHQLEIGKLRNKVQFNTQHATQTQITKNIGKNPDHQKKS